MASKNFRVDIDLNLNQLLEHVVDTQTGSDPAGAEGRFIYRSDEDVLKYYDGAQWVTLASTADVTAAAAGLDPKESVRMATTQALESEAFGASGITYSPVAGTLTQDVPGDGAFTGVDSVGSIVVGDRVLVKDQADARENGIYTVTTIGDGGATAWVLTRAEDQNGTPAEEVSGGNFTFVENGTTNQSTGWIVVFDGQLVINDATLGNNDNMDWTQFNAATIISAGDGIAVAGSTVSVDLSTNGNGSGLAFDAGDSNRLEVDPSDGITIDANGVAVNLTANNGLQFTGAAGSGTLGVELESDGGLGFDGTNGGIEIVGDASTSNTIAIATTANGAGIVYDAGKGLTETSDTLEVNLEANGGIVFDGTNGGLEVNPDSTTGATVAPVSVGTNGIGVTVDNTTITHAAGTLSVAGYTPISGTTIARKYVSASTNLGTTPGVVTITHNLNTQDVQVTVRDSATNELVECEIIANAVNTVTVEANGATFAAFITVIG